MNIVERLKQLPKGTVIKIDDKTYAKLSDKAYDELQEKK